MKGLVDTLLDFIEVMQWVELDDVSVIIDSIDYVTIIEHKENYIVNVLINKNHINVFIE